MMDSELDSLATRSILVTRQGCYQGGIVGIARRER
jgi:hypothetical protein